MKIYLVFILSLILSLAACTTKEDSKVNLENENNLLGLWCNDFHCIYFEEETCVFNYKQWNSYTATDSTLMLQGEKSFEKIDFSLTKKNDRLIIEPKFSQGGATSMSRTEKLNHKDFSFIKYSQISPFSEFDVSISDAKKIVIQIKSHPLYEPGKYSSKISDSHFKMLKDLIQGIPLKLEDELNPKITSDVVEWALIIYDEENNQYPIYYNNINMGSEGKFLSSFMDQLPFFMKQPSLFQGKISFGDVSSFRKNQFQKNIELQKDTLQ